MSAAGLLLLSVLAVPPGEPVIDHNQPGQWGHQPVVRYFVRRPVDDARGHAWMIHCDVLDRLWAEYRSAGSTPHAWDVYKRKAAAAKRYYVYQDPYYVAQVWQVNVPMPHPAAPAVRRLDPSWRGLPTLPVPEMQEPPHLGLGVAPGSQSQPYSADPRLGPQPGYPPSTSTTEPGADILTPATPPPADPFGSSEQPPAYPESRPAVPQP